VSEEERRRRLHRADGSFVSDPPEALEDCWWGQGGRLPGPGRAEARQSSATATIRSATTTTTTTIGPATATTTWGLSPLGAPAAAATAAATAAVAPLLGSLESPGPQVSVTPFSISLFIMPTGLNPSFACQGFLPYAPKVVPPPPDTMSGWSGSQQQASAGSGAGGPPRLLQLR
jgi:hypothetical protein